MKKSLLALAVLGAFVGTASAQSSVTIYGSLDMSVAKRSGADVGDNPAPNNGAPGNSAWTVQQSNSSRLGFRGNEDLGGGLSAQFQIEHRFHPDTGALDNADVFWQARSYVQLTSATAGSIYLGRDYTPAFWLAVKSDPFGWDGVGQLGSKQWAGYLSTGGVRAPNTVGYKSPKFGGLSFQGAVGAGEGADNRMAGFNVEYGAGPIYAALGYEKLSGNGLAGQNAERDGNSLINLAFHYDLGMIKPMLYLARAKVSDGVTGGQYTNKYWSLGALAPIGGGKLKVAYGRLTIDGDAPANGAEGKFGLGYDYPLSKRTNVYADLGYGRKSGTNAAGVDYDNNTAIALGVKHTF